MAQRRHRDNGNRRPGEAEAACRGDGSGGPSELDLGILPGLLGYQLRRAQMLVHGGFAERLAGLGLTAAQFGVLVLVGANPGSTQAALAEVFATDRSVMVRLIDRLEAAGLVARKVRPRDRRSNAIVLTAQGRKTLGALEREVRAHEARFLGRLGPEDAARLIALLARLNETPPGPA